MRRRAVHAAAIAAPVASTLAVGVGFPGTAAVQYDGGDASVDEGDAVVSDDRPPGGDVVTDEQGPFPL